MVYERPDKPKVTNFEDVCGDRRSSRATKLGSIHFSVNGQMLATSNNRIA